MCVMCVVCVVYTDFPFVANSDVADELRIVPTLPTIPTSKSGYLSMRSIIRTFVS